MLNYPGLQVLLWMIIVVCMACWSPLSCYDAVLHEEIEVQFCEVKLVRIFSPSWHFLANKCDRQLHFKRIGLRSQAGISSLPPSPGRNSPCFQSLDIYQLKPQKLFKHTTVPCTLESKLWNIHSFFSQLVFVFNVVNIVSYFFFQFNLEEVHGYSKNKACGLGLPWPLCTKWHTAELLVCLHCEMHCGLWHS